MRMESGRVKAWQISFGKGRRPSSRESHFIEFFGFYFILFFSIFPNVEWTSLGGKESGTGQVACQSKSQYSENKTSARTSLLSTPQKHDSYKG